MHLILLPPGDSPRPQYEALSLVGLPARGCPQRSRAARKTHSVGRAKILTGRARLARLVQQVGLDSHDRSHNNAVLENACHKFPSSL